jgi:hypothetical protein
MAIRSTQNYEQGTAPPMTHPDSSAARRTAFNEQISAKCCAAAEATHPGETANISTYAEHTTAASSNDNATTL